MHGALGFAGGAGGVHQNGQVFGLAACSAQLNCPRVLEQIVPPDGAQGVQADDAGIIQVAQTLHVEHHDLAQSWQLGADLQRLVQLFIVLDEQHGGAGVFAEVAHLRGRVGRVNAVGNAPCRQHGQVGTDPLDHGVGQDGSAVALGKTQAQQAPCDFAHRVAGLGPGPASPQAQVFLPHPDLGAALGDTIPEQGGYGFTGQDDVVARLTRRGIPELSHSVSISRSSFSSSAALRARHLP